MPKSKRSVRPLWLFRDKAAVVQAADLDDVCDRFSVSIRYEESTRLGSITVHHAVAVEGFDTVQSLSLIIRPELIASCHMYHNNSEISIEALSLMPDTTSGIITVAFKLRTPGRIICPNIPLPLCPENTKERRFVAFSRLCQAKHIRLYLARSQLQAEQLSRLQKFVTVFPELRANPIDLRCLAGGRGAQETEWVDIHPQSATFLQEPQAIADTLSEEPQALAGALDATHHDTHSRKRPRESSAPYAPAKFQRLRHEFFPGSPTEVNTPSTRQGTQHLVGSCSPTSRLVSSDASTRKHHCRGDRTTSNTPSEPRYISGIQAETPLPAYSHIVDTQPAPSSPDTKPKGPDARAHTPLPVYSPGTSTCHTPSTLSPKASGFPWESPSDIKPTVFGPDPSLSHALRGMLQTMLPKIIEGAFSTIIGPLIDARLDALITRKLDVLVREQLPQLTDGALQTNMDIFLANVEDGHKRAEVELGETVDEAKTELHEARDQGIKDIEEYAQDRLEEFDCDIDAVMTYATEALEDKTTHLKARLDNHLRKRCLELKRGAGVPLGDMARRRSM